MSHSIGCSVQAPISATVHWAHNNGSIVPVHNTSICTNESTVFSTHTLSNGTVDGFAFFNVSLHICNTSFIASVYNCVVTDESIEQKISLSVTIMELGKPMNLHAELIDVL